MASKVKVQVPEAVAKALADVGIKSEVLGLRDCPKEKEFVVVTADGQKRVVTHDGKIKAPAAAPKAQAAAGGKPAESAKAPADQAADAKAGKDKQDKGKK